MNANYAEMCRVGFSTSSSCSVFLKFSQYCCETSVIQIQQRKVKNIFLEKNSKNHFTINLHRSDQFLAINLIFVYKRTKRKNRKDKMVSDKINQNKIFSFKIKCQAKKVFLSVVERTLGLL